MELEESGLPISPREFSGTITTGAAIVKPEPARHRARTGANRNGGLVTEKSGGAEPRSGLGNTFFGFILS